MHMTRYPLQDVAAAPNTVPETDHSKVDAATLYRQAGVEPPERPGVSRLRGRWRSHRSGAFVIYGDDALFVFDR
jgi:hypothetical protein